MRIDHGKHPKGTFGVEIEFKKPFQKVPYVVVAPHWEGSEAEVGHAETIVHVSKESFGVISGNAAPHGYYVQWIATSDEPS
jgi:hypothetical protein